jgi:hypothetical protein
LYLSVLSGRSIYFEGVKRVKFGLPGVSMSWEDAVCLCLLIIGFILFLYGSNYYSEVAGWLGIFMIIGSIIAVAILRVYNASKKSLKIKQP